MTSIQELRELMEELTKALKEELTKALKEELTKALKEELRKSLKPMEKRIEGMEKSIEGMEKSIEGIGTRLEHIENVVVSPRADTLARRVTITLMTINNEVLGHGLFVEIGGAKYLLSAAHVLFDIKLETTFKIQWHGMSSENLTSRSVKSTNKVFLDKRYIKKGSHDIGLMGIETDDSKDENNLEGIMLKLPRAVVLGDNVVGHGLVYLRGGLVHLDENKRRAMFQAISVPGCSGCPLFDNASQLIALVHGNSKHRHNSSAAIDNQSHSVFADIAKLKEYEFQLVNIENIAMLVHAEMLPDTLAAKSSEKFSLKKEELGKSSDDISLDSDAAFLSSYTKKYFRDLVQDGGEIKLSWDDLMARVAPLALVKGGEKLEFGTDAKLFCFGLKADPEKEQELKREIDLVTPEKQN